MNLDTVGGMIYYGNGDSCKYKWDEGHKGLSREEREELKNVFGKMLTNHCLLTL